MRNFLRKEKENKEKSNQRSKRSDDDDDHHLESGVQFKPVSAKPKIEFDWENFLSNAENFNSYGLWKRDGNHDIFGHHYEPFDFDTFLENDDQDIWKRGVTKKLMNNNFDFQVPLFDRYSTISGNSDSEFKQKNLQPHHCLHFLQELNDFNPSLDQDNLIKFANDANRAKDITTKKERMSNNINLALRTYLESQRRGLKKLFEGTHYDGFSIRKRKAMHGNGVGMNKYDALVKGESPLITSWWDSINGFF